MPWAEVRAAGSNPKPDLNPNPGHNPNPNPAPTPNPNPNQVQSVVASARPSATLNANHEKQLRVWTGWKEFPGLPEWM